MGSWIAVRYNWRFLSKRKRLNSAYRSAKPLVLWRRGRDSNPCGVAPKRFSRPPRYDRFDTSPKKMELLIGVEPMTSSLPRMCSTNWAIAASHFFISIRFLSFYLLSLTTILLYHREPDLSIVFSKKIEFFWFFLLPQKNHAVMRIFGGAPGELSRNPPKISKIFFKNHKNDLGPSKVAIFIPLCTLPRALRTDDLRYYYRQFYLHKVEK